MRSGSPKRTALRVISEIIGRNGSGQASTQRRYYISSLPAKAALLGRTVRAHWGIENSMHWVLGVAFREDDDCRIRIGEAPQNFAVLRRIALNLLKNDKSTKLGVANKRLRPDGMCLTLPSYWGCQADPSCACPGSAAAGPGASMRRI